MTYGQRTTALRLLKAVVDQMNRCDINGLRDAKGATSLFTSELPSARTARTARWEAR